jgi:hydrogenase-1 operon protein HyaE
MNLHPLLARLQAEQGATLLAPETLDEWAARPGEHVLFFSGDPVRFGEVLDVAVVLPELRAAFRGRFDIGLIAREHEDTLAKRFGVQRWPSLVFVREGGYLATVSGMRDWADYIAEVGAALDKPAGRAPTVGIAVVAAQAANGCH